ncbi:hypothetical protein M404DRAFT_998272 [Pisolithus tinctorius Marx 270]|uniref:Uncharacterized protein n=1 Tax=Pisolithus tinctorius Marx 270 TaxID=870435 RepID=A0A0C3PG04_PISTI|nr:hypothetical protein M404DRAFT_998272 [Pisolithus tinctorius Marx 270]
MTYKALVDRVFLSFLGNNACDPGLFHGHKVGTPSICYPCSSPMHGIQSVSTRYFLHS